MGNYTNKKANIVPKNGLVLVCQITWSIPGHLTVNIDEVQEVFYVELDGKADHKYQAENNKACKRLKHLWH